MQDMLIDRLEGLKSIRRKRKLMFVALIILSLLVTLDVFWLLRQPGLTLAGDAACGITEHTHDETCSTEEMPCDLEEHTHIITCYSDETADVETPLDWQQMFADYPYTGNLRKDLVGIAQTQVGYSESELNFEVDEAGIRRGYTRYGAWYNAPYSDWSAMFVSFCLNYAGGSQEETPFNIGSDSMAKSWNALGKYAEAGEYTPVEGDIVFFADDTVGIVTTVQSAAFYVVRGDVEGAVRSEMMSKNDPSIEGWGMTESSIYKAEDTTYEKENLNYPDITQGPVVLIYAGEKKESQIRRFALKNTQDVTDLVSYLKENNGNYFYTLLDTNNRELPKDEAGNYIVSAGTSYKLTLTINNPNGFLPGTYLYHLPDGLIVNGGTGSFILKDGTNVGDWEVTDDGQITLVFNEHMNSRTDITISATMGIMFPEQEEPLDFDGKITVTIEPPPEEDLTTALNKWGSQGGGQDQSKPDASKLYWTVLITGREGSQIPGSIVTDDILYGKHTYSASDIAGGINIGVSEPDPVTGEAIDWHGWSVSADDPALTWTEKGWSYEMPETVVCDYCGEVQLGNNGWVYYIEYTSTPDPGAGIGELSYANRVTVDGKQVEGWASFLHGNAEAGIYKQGVFHGDADGGSFIWEVQTTIPGLKEGQPAQYAWYIMDTLNIKNNGGYTVGYAENNINLAKITATNSGKTFNVPNIKEASDEDQFAWDSSWSPEHNGIHYGREMSLYSRCHCTEETCANWGNGKCNSGYWFTANDGTWTYNGFCHCWAVEGDTNITFSYETEAFPVIDKYGGQQNELFNEAILYNRDPDKAWTDVSVISRTDDSVPIPGVFKKELTQDFNGYTASYEITVNESKLALTDGSPLRIHDMMSETLAYISGSLVITTEDASGNKETLHQGEDYTVIYDGTGNEKDKNGDPVHVLDILILKPQPVMYILDYDAMLIIPENTTQAIKYSNSAAITLWGEDMTDSSEEKVYADINIAAKSYRVEMHKKDSMTGEPLPGAIFGLFNEQGGLITSDITDSDGELLFETNIIMGIILREHVLYYMQELEAPPGYQLDDTKYWICFCSGNGEHCETCEEVIKDTDAARIPFEQVGKVHVENTPVQYNLPATGGPGIYPLIYISVMLILISLIYGFIRRRNEERRDTS